MALEPMTAMERRFVRAFPDGYYETQRYRAVCFRRRCPHGRRDHVRWRVSAGPTIYLHGDEFHVHQRSWDLLDGLDGLRNYVTANAFHNEPSRRGDGRYDHYLAPCHADAVIEIMRAWLRNR